LHFDARKGTLDISLKGEMGSPDNNLGPDLGQ
jgi:hypothetical protein